MSENPKDQAYLEAAWRFAWLLTGCEEGASKVFDETVEEISRHPHPGDHDRTRQLFFSALRRRALKFPARCELTGPAAALHRALEPGRSVVALLDMRVFSEAEIERSLGIDHRTQTAAAEKTRTGLEGAVSADDLPLSEAAHARVAAGASVLTERHGGKHSFVKNPATIAVGLGFLLMVAVLVWNMLGRAGVFPDEAIKIADTGAKAGADQFEPVETTLGGLQDWFMLKGFDGFRVPPALEKIPVVGVRLFKSENEPIAQALVLENRMSVFCFNGRPFGINAPPNTWKIDEGERLALAIREENGVTVLLAFRGTKEQMRKFLENAGALP